MLQPSKRSSDFLTALSGATGKAAKPNSEEAELMEIIKELIGARDYREFGGLWRTYIRGNERNPPRPGKVQRVFAQLVIDKREGFRPAESWNKYAFYLYQEFADWPSDRHF